MKQLHKARLASAALSAALLLPLNPVYSQETSPTSSAPDIAVTPPPVAEPVNPPITQPTPVVTPAADPSANAITVEPEERPARAERAATRRSAPTPVRSRTATRTPASQPLPAESAPAPAPGPEAAATAPVAQAAPLPLPAPLPVDTPAASPAASQEGGSTAYWPWLIGAALLAGLFLLVAARRRRSRIHDDYRTESFNHEFASEPAPAAAAQEVLYGDDYVPADPFGDAQATSDDDSLVAGAPLAAAAVEAVDAEPAHVDAVEQSLVAVNLADAAPSGPSTEPVADVETIQVTEPEAEELAALTAGATVAERPWLELMMRPVRAGTTEDEARVEFELTVGNNGSVPAETVRISSWMFPAGTVQPSAMERMLIEPPAETRIGEVTIPPGHGAKIAASISMPRSRLNDPVLPVVVADARYPLPDGGEGRISASFAVGQMVGEEIEPFSVEQPSGLDGAIGSRLYGEVHSA